MCIDCAVKKVNQLKEVFPPHPESGWSVCILDHGNHVHLRVNGQGDDATSEWVQVPVEWDVLVGALPPDTRIHRHGSESKPEGCSEELVREMPVHVWGPADAATAATGEHDELCAVCYDTFSDGDEVTVLPCAHRYHAACVAPWLLKNNSCPNCRTKVTAEAVAGSPAPAAIGASRPGSQPSDRRAEVPEEWVRVTDDGPLEQGARVRISGEQVRTQPRYGVYETFKKRSFGANEHSVSFENQRPELLRFKGSRAVIVSRPRNVEGSAEV